MPPFSDGAEIDKGPDFRYAILIDINVVELKQRGEQNGSGIILQRLCRGF